MSRPIPISAIDVRDRLRPVDPHWVDALAEMMRDGGQIQPIVVRPAADGRFVLVAGAHRLVAAARLGWDTIEAAVDERLDDRTARLAEIDENLGRHELTALDRAIFLAERKRIWEELHPETRHGGARKPQKSNDDFKSPCCRIGWRFTKEAAERTGLSERTVWRASQLAEALDAEAQAMLRGTPLADNQAQLMRLAREDAEDQRRIATVIAAGQARSLTQAREAAGLVAPVERDADQQSFNKLLEAWTRASRKGRRLFLETIGAQIAGEPAQPKRARQAA